MNQPVGTGASGNFNNDDVEMWAKHSKSSHVEEDDITKELCLCNGLSAGRLSQDGRAVQSLEMFFSGYPRICGLHHFPNLTILTVIGQVIEKIEGLSCLTQLSELWLCECQIEVIENLNDCTNIQKLYLYSNLISRIENLETLDKLKVLWLNSNNISNIENLSSLSTIEDLNLADNCIESIGKSLENNKMLEHLNLSANPITSLKEITNLITLPKLRSLSFKDPQSKPCPVSQLCNYSTHILYHLPHLQMLDTYPFSNRSLFEHVESTVMKKQIFYKMRENMIRRDIAERRDKAVRLREKLVSYPNERIKNIIFVLKSIEREINELVHAENVSSDLRGIIQSTTKNLSVACSSSDIDSENYISDIPINDPRLSALTQKKSAIKERLSTWKRKINTIDAQFDECKSQLANHEEILTQRLLTEFESGGNISFEDGQNTDPWYTCVHDLILSRFCSSDYLMYCINGVKILGITKVTNRMLRMKLDARMLELGESVDGEYYPGTKVDSQHKHLDYLFWKWEPALQGGSAEPERVLREGFMDACCYEKLGTHSAVPLSNSLFLSDQARIAHAVQTQNQQALEACSFRFGTLIVARTYVGKTTPWQERLPIAACNYPKMMSVNKMRRAPCTPERSKSVGYKRSDVDHNCDCQSRQCEWFLFDHHLALPEYIVQYEYVTKVKPLSPFVHLNESLSDYAGRCALGHPNDDPDVDNDVLLMEPQLKKRARMVTTTEDLLMRMLNVSNLSSITELNLLGNGLTRVKYIQSMSSLKRLIVSFNELTRIDEFSNAQCLEYLDVSFNKITTLEGLKSLLRVKYLDLSWNQLHNTREELSILRKHVTNVAHLDLRHNNWQKAESLRMRTLGRLRHLQTLDGTAVKEDVARALWLASTARISQQSLITHGRTDRHSYRAFTLLSTAQTITKYSTCRPEKLSDHDTLWYSTITTLNLDKTALTKLSNMEKLVNLRWASFNDNYLTKIEGLDTCENLEELSLSNNCINQLSGLSRLTKLTRIQLSRNSLTSLDYPGLPKLSQLTSLSLESNRIASLAGIQKLESLIELYIGNNCLCNLREVFYLKNLGSLIILDMYGNPVWKNETDYRMFVIYHLKSLKALDGSAIQNADSTQAKDLFGGRLTGDVIAEKFGHSSFENIAELDFPNSLIKFVEFGPRVNLSNIHSINLEQNGLTSLSGLIHLRSLRVLCLNCNRIECILPDRVSDNVGDDHSSLRSVTTSYILPNIEVLHLGYNGITDLKLLQVNKLTSLRALFLQGNEISKLEGIECLHSLRELVLDQNKIKSIGETSLCHQRHLLELHLEDNRIRELKNLSKATHLERLFLGSNRVQDVIELDQLAGLNDLIELSLVNNPVTRKMMYRTVTIHRVPKLSMLDGQPVTDDDRCRVSNYFYEQEAQQQAQTQASIHPLDAVYSIYKPQTAVKVTNMQLGSSAWGIGQLGADDSLGCLRKRGFGQTASPSGSKGGIIYINNASSNGSATSTQVNHRSQALSGQSNNNHSDSSDRPNNGTRYNKR